MGNTIINSQKSKTRPALWIFTSIRRSSGNILISTVKIRYIFKANRNARKVIAKLRRVYFANKSKKGLRICGDLSVLRPPEYNASYHYKASGSVAIW